jgi:hypothetical protein
MLRLHRDQRGQSLVIVLSLITIMFLLGSSLAVHASVALRSTRASEGQGDEFYAADAATELGIWWQRNGKAGNPPAQTINGVTTSTTITSVGGGGGSCPAAPNPVWMTGFEGGNFLQGTGATPNAIAGGFAYGSEGTNSFGTLQMVSTPVHTGNHALQISPNAGAMLQTYHEAPYGITLGPTLVAHVAIRMGVFPTGDASVFSFNPGSSTGLAHASMYVYYKASSGKWALGLGNNTITVFQESTVTAVLNTWYQFDVRFPITASNVRTGEWYIDGVAQPTATVTDNASFTASTPRVALGNYALTPPTYGLAYTAYYDDVIISTTPGDFPIGDINIQPLRPDAMGTHNTPANFQNQDNSAINATSWQRIDENPATITDSIKQVTASATSYIETTLSDTTQTCIRAADAVMGVHNGGTSANATKTSIFDGATESILFSGDTSVTSGTLNVAIKPITPGGAWTQARANGLKLRLGYGSDISPLVSWDSVIVELAYSTVVASPATITIVGTGGGSTITTDYLDAGAGIPTLNNWATTK